MSSELIVLDLTGVLVFKDRELHSSSCADFLTGEGYSVSANKYYEVFKRYSMPYSLGEVSSRSEFYELILEDLGIPFRSGYAESLHELFYEAFKSYPQVPSILAKLKQRRHSLFLVTNLVTDWMEYVLKEFGLDDFFDGRVNPEVAGVRKPDPRIYEVVFEQADVVPGDCVYFDDKRPNCVVGSHLGMSARLIDEKRGLVLDEVRDLIEK